MRIKKIFIYIIAIAAVIQGVSFLPPIPQVFYYLIMGLGLFFIIAQKPNKYSFLVFLFITASAVSLIVNDIPSIFKADERFLIFIIISTVVGPLLNSTRIYFYRIQIFIIINRILILFSALSFITYILGISFPRSGTGPNSGLFDHSLMLGPLAAVSILLLSYIVIDFKNLKFHTKYKKYIYLLIILALLALLVSSSRTSIIGLIAALLFFIFKVNKNKTGKFISTIVKILLIVVISSPIWLSYTDGIRSKMEFSEAEDDLTASRSQHWDARVYEFNSSPIFGIGFATGDINSPLAVGINENTGGLEPGSSWMALLAMTGIFGFGVIAFLFIYLFLFLWRDNRNLTQSGILGGLLIFFSLHMGAEGYILAAGSFLFFYVWLLLGIIQGYKNYGTLKLI